MACSKEMFDILAHSRHHQDVFMSPTRRVPGDIIVISVRCENKVPRHSGVNAFNFKEVVDIITSSQKR